MKILFTGGGTGGHIFPIIAVVREIKKLADEETSLFYLGPKDKRAETILLDEGIKVKTIMAGKLRRYFGLKAVIQNFLDIFLKFPGGFFQSLFCIFFLAPDVIFSKGGYGSLSVTLAGFLLRIPVFLHESDAVPGLANTISAKFSSKIFVSFSDDSIKYFPVSKTILVGNPIRQGLLGGSKETAKKIFNIIGEKPIILLLGGSQGAQRLNELILQVLPEILITFELLHQTGIQNFEEVNKSANIKLANDEELKKYYHLFSFLDEEQLKQAYNVSDLIISRAGSGTIFEISAQGKPSILIPLPESAQDHQAKNAYAYAKNGACRVIEEINLTAPHFFLEGLTYLMRQTKELERMRNAAKDFSMLQAARQIARYILGMN